jgi:hypothetical protein
VASDGKTGGSIYDILYGDTRRLSSLISQFSQDGLVTELLRSAEDATSAQASLSIKVVKGGSSASGKTGKTQKIDPQWLLPLLFLDEAQDLIERDITKAAIGSLVLVTGRMIVADLRILQKLWSVPSTKKLMLHEARKAAQEVARQAAAATGASSPSRASRKANQKPVDTSEAEITMEMLPLLPHSPQVNIVTPEATAWSTIDPLYFVGAVEDLLLKHGAKLPGAWSMVGILDARPWEERDDDDYDDWLSVDDRIRIGGLTENIWKVAIDLAGPARQALGRPLFSYGVTPLIIFREIETPATVGADT